MKKTIALLLVLYCTGHQFVKAAESDVMESLKGAVLCEANPFDTLRNLTKHGSSQWSKGFVGADFGEEMSHTNVLVLKKPLIISGASAFSIIGDLEGSYYGFPGLVYGIFRGDFNKAVKELGLVKVDSEHGTYGRSSGKDLDGNPDSLCPKTIYLTPKEGDKFLLGCGWCNG